MHDQLTRALPLRASALILCTVLGSGCKILLPGHPNSEETLGEQLVLRVLTFEDLEREYDDNDFGIRPAVFRREVETAEGLISVVSGLAANLAARLARREARKYEAQYSLSRPFADFWVEYSDFEQGYVQHYAAIELTRYTEDYFCEPAAKMLFLLRSQPFPLPGETGEENVIHVPVFSLEPAYLQVRASKAKVLSFKGNWYTFLWFWALDAGNTIGIDIEIDVGGRWIEAEGGSAPEGAYRLKSEVLATAKFQVDSYSLNETPVLSGRFAGKSTEMFTIRVPQGAIRGGHFWVAIRVTERDESRAKRALEYSATKLDE